MSEYRALGRLISDGFIRQLTDHFAPTPRWHAAVARATVVLMLQGEELEGIDVPVAWALQEEYGASSSEEELLELAQVMTPLTGVSSSVPPEDLFDLHR